MITKRNFRAAALLCSVWLLSACGGEKTPQEVTAAFWTAVVENDAGAAVKHSTLGDEKDYDGFSRDWSGLQPQWGRITIDGDAASIVTTLGSPASADGRRAELVTYLVRQDEEWKVDYARTDRELNDPVASLFGQISRLTTRLSDEIKVASDDLGSEMKRLAEQFEQLAVSVNRQASESIERYGKAIGKSMDELVESIERALREENLSKEDQRVLRDVATDLNEDRTRLSQPTVESVADSSRSTASARLRLNAVDDEAIEPYKKQWREWVERIEADLQRLVSELSASQPT